MKLNYLKNFNKKKNELSPLYKMERKQNYKTLIWVSILTVLTMLLVVFLFDHLDAFIETPTTMSFKEYFSMTGKEVWGIFGVVYGAYLGFIIIADNFNNGSSQLLYTQNASRNKILYHKLLRLFINLVILNVVVGVFTYGFVVMLQGFNAIDLINYLIYALVMFIMSLQAAVLSFGLTLFLRKKISTAVSILVPFVLTTISLIVVVDNSIIWLAMVSPLSVVIRNDTLDVLLNGFAGINLMAMTLWSFVPLFILPFAFIKFNKSDLV